MNNQLVPQLKQLFPGEAFGQILKAMRSDPVIWGAFEDPVITKQMVDLAGANASRWTPAFLALTVLGLPGKYRALRTEPISIEEQLKYRAAAQLEQITANQIQDSAGISLELIGMAALALRERWIMLNQPDISDFNHENNPSIWNATAACLAGMLPDPGAMIRELLRSHSTRLQALALHIVSTNPHLEGELFEQFDAAAEQMPTIERIEFLRRCSQTNPQLAQRLAERLIDQFSTNAKSAANPFEIIQNFAEMSELFRITGQYEQAIPALEQLWKASSSLQTDLTAQLAQAAAKANHQETAIKAVEQISQLEESLQPDDRVNLTLAQIHTSQIDPNLVVKSINPDLSEITNPATLVAQAQAAVQQGNSAAAQTLANQAYELSLKSLKSPGDSTGVFASGFNPDFIQNLIELLIELDLVIEAGSLCDAALTRLPNNYEIIDLASKAAYLSGDIAGSIENAQIAVALAPENSGLRKQLIDLLVRQHEWKEALQEVRTYISEQTEPSAEDFLLLSTCLLKTDQAKDAIIAAKKGLERDSDNDQLHAQLGEIHQLEGSTAEALKHFNQAILLNPQQSEYWSQLAEFYQSEGNTLKAEETLKSAFDVIPHNPRLHLQLGKIRKQNGNEESALAELQQARQYLTAETDGAVRQAIYSTLGQSLQSLGYHQEALSTLEEGHQVFPVDPEIAHLYGKALFNSGQTQAALSAYQIASQAPSPPAEMLLDHSQALLSIGDKTGEARAKILRALEMEPDNPLGRALSAEAAAQSGEHTDAIRIYQQVLQTDLADQADWRVKLSTNLAKSAFALNQPEIAITVLQDALQKEPDSLAAKQALCDAYIQTDLSKDARLLIDEILEQHPQSLETLMWAADQAIIVNDLDFAAEILNQARQLSPQKADILVRLGYIQLETGYEELARNTFGQLFSAENVDIKNLRLAAQALIGLGDISSSIPYLEKALELSDYKSSDLLNELTKLHLKSGNLQSALETVQKQIKIQPAQSRLYLTQADIYSQLTQPTAALNSMMKALELSPNSAPLQAKTASLLRKNHDLSGSLKHITQAYQIDPDDLRISLQAAQTYAAGLLDQQALEICSQLAEREDAPMAADWLIAELYLDHPDDDRQAQAAHLAARASEQAEAHPGVLAVLSRLAVLQGDMELAEKHFEQAMINLSEVGTGELEHTALSAIDLSLAKAAIDLKRWDIALYFAKEAQQLTPNEPAPPFIQAVIYTRRAESQCRDAAILRNCTSRQVATHQIAQNGFLNALKAAETLAPDQRSDHMLATWRARGELALRNANPLNFIELLSDTPENFAALLAAVRRANLVPDFDLTRFHDQPAVLFERALLNANQNPESGLSLAESLVQSEPTNPDYAALYAVLARKAGQTRLSLNSIEIALSACPMEASWHAFAAEAHLALGSPDLAIGHLTTALELEKDNPEYLFLLGQAHFATSPSSAIQVFEQATKINPLEPEYWIHLAKSYARVGSNGYALNAARQALKLAPNNLDYLLSGAEIALDGDDSQLSNQLIKKAISLPTQNIDEIVQISELLVSLDQLDDAMQYLQEKIDLAVDQTALKIQQAKLVGLRQGSQEKLDLLIQLAKENSKNPLIYAHLAEAYIETENPEEAIRAAQFALKYADSRLTDQDRTRLHYQLGVLLKQAGQLDQALHQLAQSLQYSPNFLEARLEIGDTLCQRKEYLKALEHFQKAIEIAPRDPRGYKEAGLLLKESKDYAAAEAMFRQAYALDSNDITVQRQLATVIALALIHQPTMNRLSHANTI